MDKPQEEDQEKQPDKQKQNEQKQQTTQRKLDNTMNALIFLKEKELALALMKVAQLTGQLENLKKSESAHDGFIHNGPAMQSLSRSFDSPDNFFSTSHSETAMSGYNSDVCGGGSNNDIFKKSLLLSNSSFQKSSLIKDNIKKPVLVRKIPIVVQKISKKNANENEGQGANLIKRSDASDGNCINRVNDNVNIGNGFVNSEETTSFTTFNESTDDKIQGIACINKNNNNNNTDKSEESNDGFTINSLTIGQPRLNNATIKTQKIHVPIKQTLKMTEDSGFKEIDSANANSSCVIKKINSPFDIFNESSPNTSKPTNKIVSLNGSINTSPLPSSPSKTHEIPSVNNRQSRTREARQVFFSSSSTPSSSSFSSITTSFSHNLSVSLFDKVISSHTSTQASLQSHLLSSTSNTQTVMTTTFTTPITTSYRRSTSTAIMSRFAPRPYPSSHYHPHQYLISPHNPPLNNNINTPHHSSAFRSSSADNQLSCRRPLSRDSNSLSQRYPYDINKHLSDSFTCTYESTTANGDVVNKRVLDPSVSSDNKKDTGINKSDIINHFESLIKGGSKVKSKKRLFGSTNKSAEKEESNKKNLFPKSSSFPDQKPPTSQYFQENNDCDTSSNLIETNKKECSSKENAPSEESQTASIKHASVLIKSPFFSRKSLKKVSTFKSYISQPSESSTLADHFPCEDFIVGDLASAQKSSIVCFEENSESSSPLCCNSEQKLFKIGGVRKIAKMFSQHSATNPTKTTSLKNSTVNNLQPTVTVTPLNIENEVKVSTSSTISSTSSTTVATSIVTTSIAKSTSTITTTCFSTTLTATSEPKTVNSLLSEDYIKDDQRNMVCVTPREISSCHDTLSFLPENTIQTTVCVTDAVQRNASSLLDNKVPTIVSDFMPSSTMSCLDISANAVNSAISILLSSSSPYPSSPSSAFSIVSTPSSSAVTSPSTSTKKSMASRPTKLFGSVFASSTTPSKPRIPFYYSQLGIKNENVDDDEDEDDEANDKVNIIHSSIDAISSSSSSSSSSSFSSFTSPIPQISSQPILLTQQHFNKQPLKINKEFLKSKEIAHSNEADLEVLRQETSTPHRKSLKNKKSVSFEARALWLDAVEEGDFSVASQVLPQIRNPDEPNDQGNTPLQVAVMLPQPDLALHLIDIGCNTNNTNHCGISVLHSAALNGRIQVIKPLVQAGACVMALTPTDLQTPAMLCRLTNQDCHKLLKDLEGELGVLNGGAVHVCADYTPRGKDELSVVEGEVVVVIRRGDEEDNGWWWVRRSDDGYNITNEENAANFALIDEVSVDDESDYDRIGRKKTEGYLPNSILSAYSRKPKKWTRDSLP